MPLDPTMPYASESRRGPLGKLEPDYTDAYTAWKAKPGPATNSQLLKTVSPVIDSALHAYGQGQGQSPNLRSRAKLMALSAMPSYDPTRATLRTHLLSQLQGLRRVVGQQQQLISVPERVALDLNQLSSAENELRDRLDRDPSDAETANHTGLSLKRIAYIRKGGRGTTSGSILQNQEDNDENQMGGPGVHNLGQEDHDLGLDFVYHDVPADEQLLMDMLLGLHGNASLSVQDTAKRLGVTPGAVSQRAARIQQRLDEARANNPLRGL